MMVVAKLRNGVGFCGSYEVFQSFYLLPLFFFGHRQILI